MTPDKNVRQDYALLESILDTVVSIDSNVQDILDRMSDHLDDVKYKTDWENPSPGEPHDYE